MNNMQGGAANLALLEEIEKLQKKNTELEAKNTELQEQVELLSSKCIGFPDYSNLIATLNQGETFTANVPCIAVGSMKGTGNYSAYLKVNNDITLYAEDTSFVPVYIPLNSGDILYTRDGSGEYDINVFKAL